MQVHYSHEADNDNTIVAHTFAHSVAVLSADWDMYWYTGISPPLCVFNTFAVCKGDPPALLLSKRPPNNQCCNSPKRAVTVPPPATNATLHPCSCLVLHGLFLDMGTKS